MIITGSNLKLIKETKVLLQQTFNIKDLGELRYFLGIKFGKSSQGITMQQRKYALALISEIGISIAKPFRHQLTTTSRSHLNTIINILLTNLRRIH